MDRGKVKTRSLRKYILSAKTAPLTEGCGTRPVLGLDGEEVLGCGA